MRREVIGSGSEKEYPYCLNWTFAAHSLWRDTMISLDRAGRALALPQSDELDFVDSSWETLPSLRSRGGKMVGAGGGMGGVVLGIGIGI